VQGAPPCVLPWPVPQHPVVALLFSARAAHIHAARTEKSSANRRRAGNSSANMSQQREQIQQRGQI
jgi:hypothetical protein